MKLYRLIFAVIMLLLRVFMGLLLSTRASASTASSRYVSPWTVIEPGQTLTFRHGLDVQPLELYVWVSYAKGNGNPLSAVPYQDTPDIHITRVDPLSVYVQNTSQFARWVRVVASP